MGMDPELEAALFANPELYGFGPADAGDGLTQPSAEPGEMDFSEFWEFMKPVMSESVVPMPADLFGPTLGAQVGDSASEADIGKGKAPARNDDPSDGAAGNGGALLAIDPMKVAENMQALLSGCAV
ncbi:hypothetical protein C8Q70DRAFT_937998 [Cubamyces menziesii]|nr:hypothetical protein C8Q70DRAFT_937998 [Cubamyces menziesii]